MVTVVLTNFENQKGSGSTDTKIGQNSHHKVARETRINHKVGSEHKVEFNAPTHTTWKIINTRKQNLTNTRDQCLNSVIQYGIMSTSDSKVVVDHERDL